MPGCTPSSLEVTGEEKQRITGTSAAFVRRANTKAAHLDLVYPRKQNQDQTRSRFPTAAVRRSCSKTLRDALRGGTRQPLVPIQFDVNVMRRLQKATRSSLDGRTRIVSTYGGAIIMSEPQQRRPCTLLESFDEQRGLIAGRRGHCDKSLPRFSPF
ncbi:hypothetical protein MTO96_000070 [Rhipicephalus appendiculatus]